MHETSLATHCVTPVLLACLYGCSGPLAKDPSGAQTATIAETTDHIEVMTGATSRVISLEEFVAMQEIENLGPLDPGEQLVCRKEKIVGSHFRSYRCFTKDMLRKYEQASRDWLRAAQYAQQARMNR